MDGQVEMLTAPPLNRGVRWPVKDSVLKRMQQLYNINFALGIAVATTFAIAFALSTLSLIRVHTEPLLYVLTGSIALFLPSNFVFLRFNRSERLRFPRAVPKQIFARMSGGAVIAAFVLLAYGLYAWPYGVAPSEHGYVDKLGRAYTERQYLHFQQWEVAYLCAWGATTVLALIALPFWRSREGQPFFGRSRT